MTPMLLDDAYNFQNALRSGSIDGLKMETLAVCRSQDGHQGRHRWRADSTSGTSDMHRAPGSGRGSRCGTGGGTRTGPGLCKVCGDRATGMYFGALVCIPCKTFFLRYAGDGFSFVCKSSRSCPITVASRTQCKFCRYQKCLQAGMYRRVRPAQVQLKEGQQLCVVCSDVANGIHFGAITCEGCKKFFRRGLVENKSYVCKDGHNCVINPRTRNKCRFCRYKLCLKAGMSREAIQMGRPSKAFTDRLTSSEPHFNRWNMNVSRSDRGPRQLSSSSSSSSLLQDQSGVDVQRRGGSNRGSSANDWSSDVVCPSIHCRSTGIDTGSWKWTSEGGGGGIVGCGAGGAELLGSGGWLVELSDGYASPDQFSSVADSDGGSYRSRLASSASSLEPLTHLERRPSCDAGGGGGWTSLLISTDAALHDRHPTEVRGHADQLFGSSSFAGGLSLVGTSLDHHQLLTAAGSFQLEPVVASSSSSSVQSPSARLKVPTETADLLFLTAVEKFLIDNCESKSGYGVGGILSSTDRETLTELVAAVSAEQTRQQLTTIQTAAAASFSSADRPQQLSLVAAHHAGGTFQQHVSGTDNSANLLLDPGAAFRPAADCSTSTSDCSFGITDMKPFELQTLHDQFAPTSTTTTLEPAGCDDGGKSKDVDGLDWLDGAIDYGSHDVRTKASDGGAAASASSSDAAEMQRQAEASWNYWMRPDLPDEDVMLDDVHIELLNTVVTSYTRFIALGQHINRHLADKFRNWLKCTTDRDVNQWIKNEVDPVFSVSSITFFKTMPGFTTFDATDQETLIRCGQSQSRLLVASLNWYSVELRNFGCFLSWRRNDAYKQRLIDYAERLKNLDMDSVEAALLNVLAVIATDFPGLRNASLIEESRRNVLRTFRAYTTAKFGTPNKRMETLFEYIPEVRQLGTQLSAAK